MSFILDALRKSETERQVQNAPGFADVPQATQRTSQPAWVWAIAALLAVNILVLIGVLLRPDGSPPAPAVADTTAVDTLPPPVATAAPVEVAREAPPVDVSAAAAVDIPAAPVTSPQRTPAAQVSAPTEAEPAPRVEPAMTQHNSGSSVRDGLKSLNELRAAGVLQLGELHLDIHVYSEQIEDRFVFVNMRKYKERATLEEGPVIREITPDGVVLQHSGVSFLLPRE